MANKNISRGRAKIKNTTNRDPKITNFIKDKIIIYFLKNKAPAPIVRSSDNQTKIFGFWVYLYKEEKRYVIRKRIAPLTYECTKFEPTEKEKGVKYTKYVDNNNGYSFSKDISVNLYYNSIRMPNLSAIRAFLYGITRYYLLCTRLDKYKDRRSCKKNKKAFSLYTHRLHLLQHIIALRNKNYDSDNFSDDLEISEIMGSIKNASVSDLLTQKRTEYQYLTPILDGLVEEGAIVKADMGNKITVKPKAWTLTSDYYVADRRHRDIRKLLFRQGILTLFLVGASIANIFQGHILIFFTK